MKLSKEVEEGLRNPSYTVEELITWLETLPEEKLTQWGVVPRLILARYIRRLESEQEEFTILVTEALDEVFEALKAALDNSLSKRCLRRKSARSLRE